MSRPHGPVEAVVFDWGGTLTPWHNIDLVAQWYPYAQAYDPVNAAELAQRLFDAEESLWKRQRESAGRELPSDESAPPRGLRPLRRCSAGVLLQPLSSRPGEAGGSLSSERRSRNGRTGFRRPGERRDP